MKLYGEILACYLVKRGHEQLKKLNLNQLTVMSVEQIHVVSVKEQKLS